LHGLSDFVKQAAATIERVLHILSTTGDLGRRGRRLLLGALLDLGGHVPTVPRGLRHVEFVRVAGGLRDSEWGHRAMTRRRNKIQWEEHVTLGRFAPLARDANRQSLAEISLTNQQQRGGREH
jgi:hypothetical protein